MSYRARAGSDIVFIWSQYDGANIEQRKIGYGRRQNQEAKLKIVGEDLYGSNQQDLDPTVHYITSVIVPVSTQRHKLVIVMCKAD